MGSSGSKQQQRRPSSINNFDRIVEQTKLRIEKTKSYVTTQQPYSGDYSVQYRDRGVIRSATFHLVFTNNIDGTGFKISGSGEDIDGSSVIEDGFARADGSAWWKERLVKGDVGLRVLSTGVFDFNRHTLRGGTWLASSREQGPYLKFVAKAAAQRPQQPAAVAVPVMAAAVDDMPLAVPLQQQQQQYIPMVSAQVAGPATTNAGGGFASGYDNYNHYDTSNQGYNNNQYNTPNQGCSNNNYNMPNQGYNNSNYNQDYLSNNHNMPNNNTGGPGW